MPFGNFGVVSFGKHAALEGDGALKAPRYVYPFRFLEDSSRAMLRAATTMATAIVYYMRVNQNSDKRISHFPTFTLPQRTFPFTIKHIHNRRMELFIFQLWHWISTFCVYLFKCYFVLLSVLVDVCVCVCLRVCACKNWVINKFFENCLNGKNRLNFLLSRGVGHLSLCQVENRFVVSVCAVWVHYEYVFDHLDLFMYANGAQRPNS